MIEQAYDAIVFDNDGVLIEPTDRERLYEAVRKSFDHFDVVAAEAIVRRAVEEDDLPFDDVRDTHGLDPAEWWSRREAAAVEIQREEIRSGTKALYGDVEALFELDHTLAIVSNNQHETIEFIVEHHELHEHFETYYGRDPTVEGAGRKPDPHYVERALEELQDDRRAVRRRQRERRRRRRARRNRLGVPPARAPPRPDALRRPTYEFVDLRALVDAVASARSVED